MQKDYKCEIKDRLSRISPGNMVTVRYPLSPEEFPEKSPVGSSPAVPGTTSRSETKPSPALTSKICLGTPPDARILVETYELYPGIELSYNYFLADQFHFHHHHKSSVLSIDHCSRGRIGWEMKGGLSLYFGSGDLSFHATDKCADSFITLPLGYYEGLTVTLDSAVLAACSPSLLREAGVDAETLCRKFCGESETAALPASSRIEHIFSEVYDLPEQTKLPYLKLKCLELLLFLNMTEPGETHTLDPYHSEQVETIRRIHDQIIRQPERRFTIEELSRQYHISTAVLKSIFKSVYGMPVASYMKQYRITQAARMLRCTSEPISVIARKIGYESQSKFTAAFKDCMKILPTDYRRQFHQ